jgi:hypothetical protein
MIGVAELPPVHAGPASGTLRRLVGFLAAAFDARYAFVSALHGGAPGRGASRVSLWLAQDFGLCPRVASVDLYPPLAAGETPEYLALLRDICPSEVVLRRLTAGSCVVLPLVDRNVTIVGHLGLADARPAFRLVDRDRLEHLLRFAAAQVEAWVRDGGY